MNYYVIGSDIMFHQILYKYNNNKQLHNTVNKRTALSWCNQHHRVLPNTQKVGLCEILVTWWKDLSLGFNNPSKQERWICNQKNPSTAQWVLPKYRSKNGDTPESQTKSCVNKKSLLYLKATNSPSRAASSRGLEKCCIKM